MKLRTFFITVIILLSAFTVRAEYDGYIVKLKDGHKDCAVKYGLTEIIAEMNLYHSDTYITEKSDCIESISPNISISPVTEDTKESPENVSLFSGGIISQHMALANADAMFEFEAYGNNIRVAVIDTGCSAHTELEDNMLKGKNYLTGTNDVTDNLGHGTHVCGVIAANSDSTIVTGAAPKAKIVPLKCFDKNITTYIKDIIPAIYDAVDVYNCRVINMSWGIKSNDPFLKEVIDYAYEKGVVMVAAVGNYGTSELCYPAAYDNVIGVSSVNLYGHKSTFAQYNKSVMITSPGEGVLSTSNTGGYETLSGTSHSTPLVTGIAAVALSVNPELTNSELYSIICNTATDLGNRGYDTDYGYGLVDERAILDQIIYDKLYVSPVNTDDTGSYVLIKNNSETNLDAISIFCQHGEIPLIAKAYINLMPGKAARVKTSLGNKISHFLWKTKNLTPLSIKR